MRYLISRTRFRGERGLTLTELTVTAAAVIFLCAAVLTAPGALREKSDYADCMENLRRVGRAAQNYAGDYSGYIPIYSRYNPLYRPTVRIFCVHGYLRRLDAWVCPSIHPYRWKPGRSLLENTRHYAVPRAQAEGNLPAYMREAVRHADPGDLNSEAFVVLGMIKDPAEYPFAAEFSDMRTRAQAGDWFYSQGNIKPHIRHGGRSNVLFADGSVEACGPGRIEGLEISDSAWTEDFDEISFGR